MWHKLQQLQTCFLTGCQTASAHWRWAGVEQGSDTDGDESSTPPEDQSENRTIEWNVSPSFLRVPVAPRWKSRWPLCLWGKRNSTMNLHQQNKEKLNVINVQVAAGTSEFRSVGPQSQQIISNTRAQANQPATTKSLMPTHPRPEPSSEHKRSLIVFSSGSAPGIAGLSS